MDRFRVTGLWTPLGRRKRSKVEQEYNRTVRAAAGACGCSISPRVQRWCLENFPGWWQDVSKIQFTLARQVGLFYLANGRLPRRNRAPEAFLAGFVSRARGLRLCRKAERYLNKHAPGWRVDHEELQTLHLLELLKVDEEFQG